MRTGLFHEVDLADHRLAWGLYRSVAEVDNLPLDVLIEAWLGRPAMLDQRFSPALERVYRAETAASRRRAVRVSSAVGLITAICLAIPIWRLLSDAHPLVRHVWLQIGLPISALSYLLTYGSLSIAWQEIQVAVSGILVSVCIAIMLCGSTHGGASLLLGSTVLILLLGLIGSRFPFFVAAAFASALLAVFVAGIGHMPRDDGPPSSVLVILMVVISFFVSFGNWRLDAETRRSYALMLRARLRQQDLSTRNSELDALARHDALTGLANRRAYDGWIESAWRQAQTAGTKLGLILIDIDSFKLYNDCYGHPGGDACLRMVATCLREQLRGTTDFVARVGGEEFAVILPGVSLENCGDVAERLRCAVSGLELPHARTGTDGMVTVSLGAASFVPGKDQPAEQFGPAQLVHWADQALYAAKRGGRNCVYLARSSMSDAIQPLAPLSCAQLD